MNPNEPLFLPQGSIRAILAIVLILASVAATFAGLVSADKLLDLAVVVTGFYFVTRPSSATGKA